jgi:hypothetical protein
MSTFSVRVDEFRVVLSKFLGLFFGHALDLVVVLAIELPLVLTTEPRPKHQINHSRHARHGHRDSMSRHVSRCVGSRVYLQIDTVSTRADLLSILCARLTKGAAIPAELPIVNCSPVATVRFPYLGLLLGSHASGSPTIT